MQSPTIDPGQASADLAAPQGASDRTARYVARLDPHLESLPSNAARLAFLSKEEVTWIALYNMFLTLVDKGHAPEVDGPDAYDYVLTICEISARKSRLEGAQ